MDTSLACLFLLLLGFSFLHDNFLSFMCMPASVAVGCESYFPLLENNDVAVA